MVRMARGRRGPAKEPKDKSIVRSEELQRFVGDMIANGDHGRLSSVNIRCFMLGHTPKRSGKICGAYVTKIGELQRVYAGLDQAQAAFALVVAKPVWEKLDANGKAALIDHELRHIGFNAAGAPALVPHDLGEFAATVRKYGIDWAEDLRKFAEAVEPHIKQLSLRLEEGGAPASSPGAAVAAEGNGHLAEAA